ncbi:MAG: hypothetical protein J6O39_03790 [Treponema sp.]|nr:hypothetical protein [Treponema sp.]
MIPQLLLEEILLGEKKKEDYYEKYGKEELEGALSELKKSDEDILKNYSPEVQQTEVMKKLLSKRISPVQKERKLFTLVKFGAAAALVLAFAFPVLNRKTVPADKTETVRIKGNISQKLFLYRQQGSEVVRLENGDTAAENDLIQITYVPGIYDYGVIFSVDGNGNLTRHLPEASWKSQKLEKNGEEVPLSFSYSLDDAPDYECFVFVASKKEFNLSEIETVEKSKYSLDFIKNGNYVPEDCSVKVFTLKKRSE